MTSVYEREREANRCIRCSCPEDEHLEIQAVQTWEDSRGRQVREAKTVRLCPTALYERKPYEEPS